MSNKPELLATPKDVAAAERLLHAGADALIIGEQRYGLRLAGEFTRADVEAVTELAHDAGKKVYVAMNALLHNDTVGELADYITFLKEAKVDAIVFGDPAVLMTAREVAPEMKLHWNTETTATNWFTANYWGRKGAKRAVLARELNMDSIIEIKENAEVEIEVQVHGMTCMFQSKRTLIGNYMTFQGKNLAVERTDQSRNMVLFDAERDAKYPIFEDENGTHIMSPNDISIIDELEEMIDAGVDSFKIDGILKSTEYMEKVVAIYRKAIDLCVDDRDAYDDKKDEFVEQVEAVQPDNRKLDTGFFFKETVY
ncbi:peptidase U32 family protein [Alkalihalophilus lindianensis]|uniref:Peptidase U32 family protein n=1 Tax=Alkalihalophilus lindianensis TaxID=1630542 RepID=A0ABU3XDI6_9BACI|nr:peptidase U32 family protein [Alkalihalophilus lindianensis]MDV2685950.1 peptidase U32 family protein [Alkalihalophilus lindianensis]